MTAILVRDDRCDLRALRSIAERGQSDPTVIPADQIRRVCEALLHFLDKSSDVIVRSRIPSDLTDF